MQLAGQEPLIKLDYATLDALRRQHPAWRLLAAEHAPLVASFLHRAFKGTISEHIKHIFEDGDWTPEATVRLFRTVQIEGEREVTREVEHYNLDMVLVLGFRVRSPVGVRFRRWANDKLKEYIVKGFVLDDARLKSPGKGPDYFDELTRRLQVSLASRFAAG